MAQYIREYVAKDIFVAQSPGFDVILNIGDRKLYAPKELLCMASPYFETMLDAGEQHEIDLSTMNYEAVLLLLRCIHPRVPTYVNENNVNDVLGLACEFNIGGIVESCSRIYLQELSAVDTEKPNWQETVVKILTYADINGLQNVIDKGVSVLNSSTWNSLKVNVSFNCISLITRYNVACGILDKKESSEMLQ